MRPLRFACARFATFLDRRNATVLDVVRGAAPGVRRLLVGDPATGSVAFAVAVADGVRGRSAVDNEEHLLGALGPLRPSLRETVPRLVGRVDVTDDLAGLVVTAVPGAAPARPPRDAAATGPLLAAVGSWLSGVWEDTGAEPVPVQLGVRAAEVMAARYAGSPRLAPALDAVRHARSRLTGVEVTPTLTHGCLCRRHVRVAAGAVVGVDDWGLAALAADPLRDLGLFVVRVADTRLPEVLSGRSSYAATVRQFFTTALDRVGVPRRLWRDVLLLTQLEMAMAALDRGDADGMAQLMAVVRALPTDRR